MNLIYAAALLVAALVFVLAAFTRVGVWWIERSYPADGTFAVIDGTRMHYHHIKVEEGRPTLMFIHGASSNLHDQMSVYRQRLEGRYNMIFVDRPGHGYSLAGADQVVTPQAQADKLAGLLDHLGVEKAILVGHSFGGAVAASFAAFHPDKTAGQILLSPVSHPWPGGVNWYYELAERPVLGRLFVQTLALPAGLARLKSGSTCVFAPNPVTADYRQNTHVPLLLRPAHFRNNARQIAALYDYVSDIYPKYSDINAPTVILTGNRDTVVLPDIHSVGLARQITDAELYWIENLGHKSDHVATDFVVSAIDRMAGDDTIDLRAEAAKLEQQVSQNAMSALHLCVSSAVIREAMAKQDKARLAMVEATYD